MKANKKTMFAAALAVAIVALAGVGYAVANNYLATTVTNADNGASSTYFTANQTTYQDVFDGSLVLNTFNNTNSTTFIYSIDQGTDSVGAGSDKGKAINNVGTVITLTPQGIAPASYSVTSKIVSGTVTDGWKYFIQFTYKHAADGDTVIAWSELTKTEGKWSTTSCDLGAVSGTITAKLYVAGVSFNDVSMANVAAGTYTAYDGCGSAKGIQDAGSIYSDAAIAFIFSTSAEPTS